MPFEQLYCDIWVGYHTVSLYGVHYFFIIMDEYSRVIWLYLMRFKSETLACLKSYADMVQTQFNAKILHIHTDNGQEFLALSTQFYFFSEHDILHEHTCVETPQQNDIVE